MECADPRSQGKAATLEEVLQARDRRVALQHQALECYRLPLISLSLVAPGEIKTSPAWLRVADYAQQAITECCQQMAWDFVWEQATDGVAGPEWMVAVCAPAKALKQQMIALEEDHPLGRLWDIDIIDNNGQSISRKACGFPARSCLLCHHYAHECARGKRHSVPQLLDEIVRRIECYERERE